MHTLARWAIRRRKPINFRVNLYAPDLRRNATFDTQALRRWEADISRPDRFSPADLHTICKRTLIRYSL